MELVNLLPSCGVHAENLKMVASTRRRVRS
jgi:hypothetical protein